MEKFRLAMSTTNAGKAEQIRKILNAHGYDYEIVTAKDLGFMNKVDETGNTFEENAFLKAKALYDFCKENKIDDVICFADDSGLCVEKLNGAPGLYSARFAGENATDEEKRQKILEALKEYKNPEDRKADFVTTMVAILNNGEKVVGTGICHGKVALEEGKTFSKLTYNPIFIPDCFEIPVSEMDDATFLKVHNHREQAMLELMKKI